MMLTSKHELLVYYPVPENYTENDKDGMSRFGSRVDGALVRTF